MSKKKCIIYTRVSTTKQEAENQVLQLQEYAAGKKYKIIDVVRETESSRNKRKKLNDILNRNDYNILLVYALDRISRNGLFETINILQHLSDRGIAFESYTEPVLNTDSELVRNLLITVLSSLAKMEREKISQRTKAGLNRARKEGKKIGRPPLKVSEVRLNKIKKLRADGLGYIAVGKKVKLKNEVVRHLCNKHNIKRGKL